MKKIFLLVVILTTSLFLVVSPVKADAWTWERVISSDVAYGCVHKDYYQYLGLTLLNGDTQAFVKGLLTAYQSGECTSLKKGTPVSVTDTSVLAGLIRIRPEGSKDEYWTMKDSTLTR